MPEGAVRVIARKDGPPVKLYSRPGNLAVPADRGGGAGASIADLHHRWRAVACDDAGISWFDRLRHRNHDDCVFLYAFDLIELNGDDLRRDPLVVRKATLTSVIAKAGAGIQFNEHMEYDDGETVFRQPAKWVSRARVKAKDSRYRSRRSSDWLKMKNPACAAMRREAEAYWAR